MTDRGVDKRLFSEETVHSRTSLGFNCSAYFLSPHFSEYFHQVSQDLWFASKEPYLTQVYLAIFSISQSSGAMSFNGVRKDTLEAVTFSYLGKLDSILPESPD